MASLIVNQGLQHYLDRWAGINGPPAAIDAMAVSNFGTLLAGTTSIASASFKVIKALTSKVRASQTLTLSATFTAGEIGGFEIKTITFHNGGAGVATGVQGGIDGQSATFSGIPLDVELDITATSG